MLRRIARALAVVALLLLGFVASSVEISTGHESVVTTTTHGGGALLAGIDWSGPGDEGPEESITF